MKKAFLFLMGISALDSVSAQTTGKELLVNGNFADNDCNDNWCFFKQANQVRGWIPDPEIQMGFGDSYNSRLTKQRIVELAGNQNTCLFQKVHNMTPGIYRLKYEYAARDGRTFDDSQIQVQFNNRELKRLTPQDYNLNTDAFDFQVTSACEGVIKFCGIGGENNSQGAVLKSVSLKRKSDQSLLVLDSHSGKCLEKNYQLESGQLQISLDYKVISNTPVKDSAVYITLNQQAIYKILPIESGKNIRIAGNVKQGTYSIGLCTGGSQYEPIHQLQISNFALNLKQCNGGWGNNLIVNGGFEQNQCVNFNLCIWNQSNGSGKVLGWEPSPQIQVGRGKFYNNLMPDSWVIELDGNSNSCIRQKVPLKSGKHSLRFDWAARTGRSFQSNELEAKVNGRVLKKIKPTNNRVNRQNIEFDLNECPAQSWIEFCGSGTSDGAGALIDNVKLSSYNSCATANITSY